MKMTDRIAAVMVTFGLAFAIAQACAASDTHAALLAESKVTEAQARATVMTRIPNGIVKSAELEREHGRLIWSFDVARPAGRGVTEIQVDAMTGKIASEKRETPAQEAREAKADKSSLQ